MRSDKIGGLNERLLRRLGKHISYQSYEQQSPSQGEQGNIPVPICMISPPVLKPISNTTSISASSPRTHSRIKLPYSNIEFAAEFTLQALCRTHHTTISYQPTDANYRPSAAEPAPHPAPSKKIRSATELK